MWTFQNRTENRERREEEKKKRLKMFEGIVADILTKILGKYVEDFNKEQLSIGIFGGNVSLKNLHIKGEALAELNLPITVIRGILGSLELQVPWKNLSSKPVVVKVDDIYILCGPQKTFYVKIIYTIPQLIQNKSTKNV